MLQTRLVPAAAIVLVLLSIIAFAISGHRTPGLNTSLHNENTMEFMVIDKPGLPNLHQPCEGI